MKRLLWLPLKLWRWVRMYALSIPIMFHALNGGWHSFRDAPDWLVKWWARFELSGDASLDSMIMQARNEWHLRLERGVQDLRRKVNEALDRASPSTERKRG
jgi:hypothetical protein